MRTLSNEPTGSPPASYTLPPEARLRRVRGVLEALSDALQTDTEYSSHMGRRALAIDLVNDELQNITRQLEEEDTP